MQRSLRYTVHEDQSMFFTKRSKTRVFTNSLQYKNANIANFVLVGPLERN